VWRSATYYSLWAVRLAGLLPDLDACLECGASLDDPEHPSAPGSGEEGIGPGVRALPRRAGGSQELSAESRAIAGKCCARRWRSSRRSHGDKAGQPICGGSW
jgi:hypothetical protein